MCGFFVLLEAYFTHTEMNSCLFAKHLPQTATLGALEGVLRKSLVGGAFIFSL